MTILSQHEAAAIFNHYFAQLARVAGLRWSNRNQADIERAAALLGQVDAAGDEIPPYRPIVSDRQTVVLDRGDYGDPEFERWRAQRREEDDAAARRMFAREERAR